MHDIVQKLVSNPQGIIAGALAAFVLVSAILTGIEKLLLAGADLLDTFNEKTATDVDNKAEEFLRKAAGVLASVLGVMAKVTNWINGFKSPATVPAPETPSPAPASSESVDKKPAA